MISFTHTATPLRLTLFTLLAAGATASVAWADGFNIPADLPTIQAGIDAALDGDAVIVAPGTYVENINFMGKAITVRSSNPLDAATVSSTIIDGGGAGTVVTCNSGEGPGTVLSGLTITNGLATTGAGMHNDGSSPTVTFCAFTGNTAAQGGGGMRNHLGSPAVTDCEFTGNTVTGFFKGGAGMLNESASPTVTNCNFTSNVTVDGPGAGMWSIDSSPTVDHCIFTANSAAGSWDAGGIRQTGPGSLTMSHCDFIANTGDAMTTYSSSATVTDCTFDTSVGWGIYNGGSDITVTDCVFTGNTQGGMRNTGNATVDVTDCVFSENTGFLGGGMYNLSPLDVVTVTGCTFSNNVASVGGGGIYNEGSTLAVTVTGCNFVGNTAQFGGGVCNENNGSMIDLLGCTFTGNSASAGDGGAVYTVGSFSVPATCSITSCNFTMNTATGSGGAMHNENKANPLVTLCTFSMNTAATGGGVSSIDNSFPRLTANGFCSNTPNAVSGPYTDGNGNNLDDCDICGSPDVLPTGACCLNGECMVGTQSDCLAAGGVFSGFDTTCAGAGCPTPCTGDANGDGVVDFTDLLQVLAGWGNCV